MVQCIHIVHMMILEHTQRERWMRKETGHRTHEVGYVSPLREPSCDIRCFRDGMVFASLRAAKKR